MDSFNLYRISIQITKSHYSKLKKLSRPGVSISQIGDSKISDSASLNLEAELVQIEALKTKNLISNEEYSLLRKKLLGL